MYVRAKSSKLSPRKTVQIVEAFINEYGQRRQRIVQHLGVAADEEQLTQLWSMGEKLIPELERRAKEEKIFASGQASLFSMNEDEYQQDIRDDEKPELKCLRKSEDVLEGPFEVWGEVFDKLGLEDILGLSDRGRGSTNALKLCLIAKLMEGGSKKRSADWLNEQTGLHLSEDRFYRMMDKLSPKIDKVKELGFRCGKYLCGNEISLVLYDVTTLYFESFLDDEDSGGAPGLRKHGFSKDCKFKETQVVLALATSREGIPLWYELFPGNKAECSTLKVMIDEMRKRLSLDSSCVVADGAMLNEGNRKLLSEAGVDYVLGASVRKLSGKMQEQALDLAEFKELECGRMYRSLSLENGNTLIVTWGEAKARKDCYDRDRRIAKLMKKLNKKGEVSGRTIIGNRGTSKYIVPISGKGEPQYCLNEDRIAKDARFDGLHAIETSRGISNLEDVKSALESYGNLWHIEDCFRVSKSGVKIRPVYHWTERRIRAHVAICFLALLMSRYLEVQLRVKRGLSLSYQRVKDVLLRVNSTIVKDQLTGRQYRFPSPLPKEAREIYKSLGLKRTQEPKEITSMVNYRRRIPNLPE